MSLWRTLSFGWYAEDATSASAADTDTADAANGIVFPDNLENAAALQEFVDKHIIYQSGMDYEGLPMLVFYACHLPDPQRVDYDALLDHLLARLDQFVERDYTVVLFSGGARYRPGWSWLFKAYKQLGRKYKKNLKRLYLVHPSIWVRLLMDMMKAVISPKFARKLSYIPTLSQLATQVPLEAIELPRAVLLYNLKYEASITYPKSAVRQPLPPRMFGRPLEALMGEDGTRAYPTVVVDCVELLRSRALDSEGLFRRSACAGDLKRVRASYDLGELVDLSDEEDYLVAVLLKHFFHELPTPLLPPSTYDTLRGIPVTESVDAQIAYIQEKLLAPMPRPAFRLIRYVFGFLFQVAEHASANLMPCKNLATVWAPNLVHGPNPIEDMKLFYATSTTGGVGSLITIAITHYHQLFGVSEIEVVTPAPTNDSETGDADRHADANGTTPNPSQPGQPSDRVSKRHRYRSRSEANALKALDPNESAAGDRFRHVRRMPSTPSITIPERRIGTNRPASFAAELGPMSMPSRASDLRRSLPPLAQRSSSQQHHDASDSDDADQADADQVARRRAHTTIGDGAEYRQ